MRNLVMLLSVLGLISCGGSGDDEELVVGVVANRTSVTGSFTIAYPPDYQIILTNTQITDNSINFLSLASNGATGEEFISSVVLCVASADFTDASREEEIASGVSDPEFTQPISQISRTVDGRSVEEYEFIDLPDPTDPDDNLPLRAIGHKYFFTVEESAFAQNLAIDVFCGSTEVGFPSKEAEIRTILDSVVIE